MRVLVAGFGNNRFGDYAYGIEVVRLLQSEDWPPEVQIASFGMHDTHIAPEMLVGYNAIIFIDVIWRGGKPGSLYVIEPEKFLNTVFDEHAIELHSVLAQYEVIAAALPANERPSIVIIGCEPESTEEGAGIRAPVALAIPATVPIVLKLLKQYGIGVGIYAMK